MRLLAVSPHVDKQLVLSRQVLVPFNMVYQLLQTVGADLIILYSIGEGLPLEVVKTVIASGLLPSSTCNPQSHDLLDYPMVVAFLDNELERLCFLGSILCRRYLGVLLLCFSSCLEDFLLLF